MKRQLVIALITISIGLAGLNQAYGWGQRDGSGYYENGIQSPNIQEQYNQLDPAGKEKLDIFFANTQSIRQQMAAKRAEKQALIRTINPNSVALSKVESELFELREAMRKNAEEAGVTTYLCPTNGPVELRKGGRAFREGNSRFSNN